jgi:hypothetical protein
VGKVVDGNDEFLQGFPNELGPFFLLRVKHCFLVVATVVILIASQ